MSKKKAQSTKQPVTHAFGTAKKHGAFSVYTHQKNGLQLLHYPIKGTGVITCNITYQVGSVDEQRGESGLAHMLEHMLFKPTKQDLANNIPGGAAMQFERDTGAVLNANTSYDRTTYYFSFPKTHLDTVLELEANRMQDVVLDDAQFQPERSNVLSEFDMYNSDPYFALEVAMRAATFQSHAYGHEVIGFREDIEDYTTEKLQRFYDMYYQPNNATLMLIGDITKNDALLAAERYFGEKKNPVSHIHRETAREPKRSGPRTVTIERPGSTNILGFGFTPAAFPSTAWHEIELALRVLADGPESILHKRLVDTGLVSSVDHYIPASPQPNMGLLILRLAKDTTHADIEALVQSEIASLTPTDLRAQLKKEKTKWITQETYTRLSSLGLANELTQYAANDALHAFSQTEALLAAVTPKSAVETLKSTFAPNTLIIGQYRSV